MSSKLYINIIVLMTIINACNTGKSAGVEVQQTPADSIYEWKIDVLMFGDTTAYNKLVYELTFKNIDHWDLLYYAQLMCNKYKYASACNECYRINHETYSPDNLKTYDSVTYKLGIYYLLKSYELGDFESQFIVKRYFGDTIPRSNVYLKNISLEK